METGVVTEIVNAAQKPQEIGGFIAKPNDWTIEDPVSLVKPGPQAKPLGVSTLGALRDYLLANRDDLVRGKLVVHVTSPSTVVVAGPLHERSRTREWYVSADCGDLCVGFLGTFHPVETFIVGLMTRFADDADRASLLGMVSSLKQEAVRTTRDDGYAQVATVATGIALVDSIRVPNPVTLCAFRTFREVEVVSSPYVLRLEGGGPSSTPKVGLFEADGGAWKLTAIARVRDWLVRELEAVENIAVLA
jgi:hypothetical protein